MTTTVRNVKSAYDPVVQCALEHALQAGNGSIQISGSSTTRTPGVDASLVKYGIDQRLIKFEGTQNTPNGGKVLTYRAAP